MSNLALYLSIGGVLLVPLIAHLFRKPDHMMLSEWRERMKKLDTVKPMKSRIEGKFGVAGGVKERKMNVTVIKPVRKTGSE